VIEAKHVLNSKNFKKLDMKEVWFYCCKTFAYYERDCYYNKDSNLSDKIEGQFSHAGSNDSDQVLLMANTQLAQDNANGLYMRV